MINGSKIIIRGMLFLAVASLGRATLVADFVSSPQVHMDFPTTTSPFGGTGSSTTVSVPGFDPSLGTLIEVYGSVGVNLIETVTFTNDLSDTWSGPPDPWGSLFCYLDNFYTYTLPWDGLFFNVPSLDPGESATTSVYGNGYFQVGSGYGYNPPLSEFETTGSVDLNLDLEAGLALDGLELTRQSGSADATVYLTYLYSPVPEPTSIVFLGTIMICVGFAMRRKVFKTQDFS